MFRRITLVLIPSLIALGAACDDSRYAVTVTKLGDPTSAVDAGDANASSSGTSGDPDGENDFGEQPLPECIVTSIGIWDDFETAGEGGRFTPEGTTAIGFDPLHHCGVQGIKATGTFGTPTALFVRDVPAIPTATKAASWSFLVSFPPPGPGGSFTFASLLFANGRRLSFESTEGKLSLVERDEATVDAGADIRHSDLASLPANEWVRIDMRLEYGTKIATLKIGPPGGTAPTQDVTLLSELAAVTSEQLGPQPTAGTVTVHYDRATIYVE